MHISLFYTLSPAGQRAELAAGRAAHRERTLALPATPWLASIAHISPDGRAMIHMRHTVITYSESVDHEADHVLTSDEAETWIRTQMARIDAARADARAAKAEREADAREAKAEREAEAARREVETARREAEREAEAKREAEAAREAEAKREAETVQVRILFYVPRQGASS